MPNIGKGLQMYAAPLPVRFSYIKVCYLERGNLTRLMKVKEMILKQAHHYKEPQFETGS